MYPVTQDFLDKMRADKRRVDAKVVIDYTDPTLDQSIAVSASEQAAVSYPQQTADGVTGATYKWASLDGSWTLDGTWHLAPGPEDLARYQFGWWSAQLAGSDGSFTEPYPTLTVTHIPRPVHRLRVVGDSARGEYPVDFRIDLYAQDDTLLRSEVVAGNTGVEWAMALPSPVLDVARQVLTISKWSHPGRQAKVLEFFTSIQETYYSGDIVEIRLLEEREASQGSLPVGNISANEISIRLANEGGKFDPANSNSPLANLLKPNRRIRVWLGLRGAGDLWGDGWYAPFDRDLAVARRDGAVQEPLPGYVATLRPGEGRFGGAVAVEEGTTNVCTNGSFESNLTGWTFPGGQYERTSQEKYFGSYSLKLTNPDSSTSAQAWFSVPNPSSYAGKTVTVTVYAKTDRPYHGRLTIREYDGSTYKWTDSNWHSGSGQWEKLTLTMTFRSTVTNIQIQLVNTVRSDDNTPTSVYFDGVLFEQKPYATSFVDGTRAAGVLHYPQLLDKKRGTLSVWINPHVVVNYNNFFSMSLSTGRFLLFFFADGSSRWDFGPYNSGPRTPAGTIVAGQWTMHTLTWDADAGVYRYYVNGELVGERQYVEPDSLPSALPTVNNYGALLDELLILPYAASEEHIARLYDQTRPLYDEWVPLGTFWSLDWDSPDDSLEAIVTARDRMELLRKSTYQTGVVQQNVSLYTLAEQVLQDAGLLPGEYWIDPALQQIVIPWAWLSPTSHREALRIIAEAALAVVYADRDGVVRIETMGRVPATPVLTITADDYFPPLQAPSRQDQVANEIVVTTQPLKPADAPQEVYRSTTPISVPAGQTVTVQARYNQPPVIEAVASLDNPPPDVSIVEATYYAWGAEITLRNTGAAQADVTLVITGKPLSVQGGEQVIVRDEASIIENGVLRYEFPANPLVQKLEQAQAIANALLASAKDPRRDLELEWRGNPALELGDRVTVVGQDVHVIRQEITWAGALSARLTGRKVT